MFWIIVIYVLAALVTSVNVWWRTSWYKTINLATGREPKAVKLGGWFYIISCGVLWPLYLPFHVFVQPRLMPAMERLLEESGFGLKPVDPDAPEPIYVGTVVAIRCHKCGREQSICSEHRAQGITEQEAETIGWHLPSKCVCPLCSTPAIDPDEGAALPTFAQPTLLEARRIGDEVELVLDVAGERKVIRSGSLFVAIGGPTASMYVVFEHTVGPSITNMCDVPPELESEVIACLVRPSPLHDQP